MLLADVMERAIQSALENSEGRLHGIRRNVTASALDLLADIAPIGFINFNNTATVAAKQPASGIGHRFTDTVRHKPSGFVGNAKHALKLLAGNAFFAGADKVRGVQPLVQGDLTALKHGANSHGKLSAAIATAVQAKTVRFALEGYCDLRRHRRAYWAIRPADCLQLAGYVFVVKACFGVGCVCHDEFPEDGSFWQGNLHLSSI